MDTPPGQPPRPAPQPTGRLLRQEREAAALRENLRRRKEQSRAIARAAEPTPGLPDTPDRV